MKTGDFQEALAAAEAARARGNEGMARVCARRAAGWALMAHLARQGVDLGTTSVIDHFRYVQDLDWVTPEMRTICEHMLQHKIREAMDEESWWPEEIDLVADAKRMIDLLSS